MAALEHSDTGSDAKNASPRRNSKTRVRNSDSKLKASQTQQPS